MLAERRLRPARVGSLVAWLTTEVEAGQATLMAAIRFRSRYDWAAEFIGQPRNGGDDG